MRTTNKYAYELYIRRSKFSEFSILDPDSHTYFERRSKFSILDPDPHTIRRSKFSIVDHCKLVVHQVPNLIVPHHYAKMVRLCLLSDRPFCVESRFCFGARELLIYERPGYS